jgi:hypothetical protein
VALFCILCFMFLAETCDPYGLPYRTPHFSGFLLSTTSSSAQRISQQVLANEGFDRPTMDPLTAVGLAGNIITFVDLSTKVLSRAKELYNSASGSTSENDELESLTKSLKDLADRTRRQAPNNSQHGRLNITSESVLDNLSQQCIQVADELLDMLDSVKVKGDGRGLKSAIQAVKTAWKQDDIDGLQRRLDRISKQLMDGMSMEQLEQINRRLREMAIENTRLEANRSLEIQQLRQDFNSAFENLKASSEGEPIPGAWLVLSDTARRGQAYFAEQVILQSLRFSSIESRHESIAKEHSNTFAWIFEENSSTKFVQWLKGDYGVYWVSGKPGSGKSTLMKFIAENEQTKTSLEEWVGNKTLVIASFFFWNASTHQSQKSQRGLLRTILYQILRQCPELIRMAYRDQWIALTSDRKVLKESRDELLTAPALLNTLRNISTSTESDTKFCFFIDGLDEYDGRPSDIIELVDILKSFPNVKTCVSSRSWNEFEDRFGTGSPWKLYMQDLTRSDIYLYVQDTLGENRRFQQLRKEDPQCPDFVKTLVKEADGVFLWVFLVTRSLLDGLTNSDRIKDLRNRLEEIPKDLQDYFKSILFSTENRYRTQTARLFTVAISVRQDLPLMAYWVIDQEDPGIFFSSIQKTTSEVLASRMENMRRRLKVLSKGLLEADSTASREVDEQLFGSKVVFLHRTVKDYLQTPDAQTMLQCWADETFNVHWEICTALGTLAKMTPREYFTPDRPIWEFAFAYFLIHASSVDKYPAFKTDLMSMLDHLQAAIAPAFEENESILYNWASHVEDPLEGTIKGQSLEVDLVIVSACACLGVTNFVNEKFAQNPQLCTRVTNHVTVLVWLFRLYSWDGEEFFGLHAESAMAMMKFLLDQGVDPNSGLNGRTEWRLILEDLIRFREDDEGRRMLSRSFEIIKLLLQSGADFEQECATGHWGSEKRQEVTIAANELLREFYDVDQIGVLEDIVIRRDRKGKKKHGITKKFGHLKLWMASKK